jgi:hypothetical protein
MSTPSLNNGIFMRDIKIPSLPSSFDAAHLLNMSSESADDMGIIDLWAQKQKKEAPLYTMSSFGGHNTIYTENQKYTWKVPVQSTHPYIVEDIIPSDITNIGADGKTFQIKLNDNFFGHSSILTYDKYNGLEFVVTEDPILPANNGYIYTVKLLNNKNGQSLDRKYLKASTFIICTGTVRDEHSTMFAERKFEAGGYREFYNHVGTARANSSYSVSDKAAVMGMPQDIVEIYNISDPNLDPNVQKIDDIIKLKGKSYMKGLAEDGKLSYAWLRKLDALHVSAVLKDVENQLMWGKGGWIRNNMGPVDTYLPVGLWKQLDNGYKVVYTLESFNFSMFENEIFNFFNGKVNFDGPDSSRTLMIQTGKAGMKLINNAIQKEVAGAGMILNATDVGALTGDRMNLEWGVSYSKLKIPFLANLEFVYNPAFDSVNNNDIENPLIEGYPSSSYSFVIFDYNYEQGSDNIKLLKWAPNKDVAVSDVRWYHQNGSFDYYGQRSGFASTGDFSGYKVKFEMNYPAIWVQDPTKILKFVIKNPITGFSL